jgi:glutamate--cysteine ligase catalytic subunit
MILTLMLSMLPSSGLGQVDENMGRAQERDAAVSNKFYFRKEVLSTARSGVSSATSSSGSSTPGDSSPRKKEKKMKNCFPLPQLPEDGFSNRLPVDEEYDEFTMNEIMNGKVRRTCQFRYFPY